MNVSSSVFLLCVDEREILLSQLKPDDFSIDSGEDVGIFSRNPALCVLVSQLLAIPTKQGLNSNGKARTVYVEH